MARGEEREGRRAWVRYGRIWMRGKWWRWDEMKEELKEEGAGEERREERRGGEVEGMEVKTMQETGKGGGKE